MSINTISGCYKTRIKSLAIEWLDECKTAEGLEAYLLELAPNPETRLYRIWVGEVAIAMSAIIPDPAPMPTIAGITYAPDATGQLTLLL